MSKRNIVTITFNGPRASGKSTLMRAIKDQLLPYARIIDPANSAGKIDEHAMIVVLTDDDLTRLRGDG